MITALFRPAAPAAVLLCLGIATAAAQNVTPATGSNELAGGPPAESLEKSAVRVPAMGTGTSTPSDAANAHASAPKPVKAASKPKKRARVVHRVYEEDDIVEMHPYDPPHYVYAPRPAYRFGYGIGPGFVYGW